MITVSAGLRAAAEKMATALAGEVTTAVREAARRDAERLLAQLIPVDTGAMIGTARGLRLRPRRNPYVTADCAPQEVYLELPWRA